MVVSNNVSGRRRLMQTDVRPSARDVVGGVLCATRRGVIVMCGGEDMQILRLSYAGSDDWQAD